MRVTVLLALAEAALMYSVYNPNDLATTGAVAAWTLITIYIIVMLVRYAERAGRHREQLNARLLAEMRESLDGIVDSLADARSADVARDAVRLVRERYVRDPPPVRRGDSP